MISQMDWTLALNEFHGLAHHGLVLRVSVSLTIWLYNFPNAFFPTCKRVPLILKQAIKRMQKYSWEREREREKESSHCILWTKNVCACVRKRYLECEWVRECARANVKAILANSAKFLSYSIFRFDWCQSLLWHSGRCPCTNTHTHTNTRTPTHTHALIHFFSFHRKCQKKNFFVPRGHSSDVVRWLFLEAFKKGEWANGWRFCETSNAYLSLNPLSGYHSYTAKDVGGRIWRLMSSKHCRVESALQVTGKQLLNEKS